MSYISVKGEQSSEEEIEMITELEELSNSVTDEFIRKVNGSFVNASVDLSLVGDYLKNIVEDTTPQLGGNLDGQDFNIITTGSLTAGTLTGGIN